MLRTAFDLYRHSILEQMHIPIPNNLVEERLLWAALNQLVGRYVMPWTTHEADKLPQLNEPL